MENFLILGAYEFNFDLIGRLKTHLNGNFDSIDYSFSGNNDDSRMWVRVKYYPDIMEDIEGFHLTEIYGKIRNSLFCFKLTRNGEGIIIEHNVSIEMIRKIQDFFNQKNL